MGLSRRIFLPALLLALSACAGYTVEGTRYRTSAAALKAQARLIDDDLASVRPLGYIGGSVLVVLPPDSQLTRPPYADRLVPRISPEHFYLSRYWRRHVASAAEAVARGAAFDDAEVRGGDDPMAYAREFGYRFVLRDEGRRWFLADSVSGRSEELHGTSLSDLGQRTQFAASVMQKASPSATARGVKPASDDIGGAKGGGYTLGAPGGAMLARARILASVKAACGGAYRIDDEFLQDGMLVLRFDCVNPRVSSK